MPRASRMPHPKSLLAPIASLLVLASLAAGCAPKKDGAGSGGATADRAAPGAPADADTGRVGNTFVVTYDSGPIDRLRIVRDTAGRIVVEGASGFPDGTRVTVALLRPLSGGKSEAAAVGRARVELGRFQSSPLLDESPGAAPPAAEGPVRLLVTVSFAPGQQTDEVMHASANGRRFRGEGMKELPGGYALYERAIEAPL